MTIDEAIKRYEDNAEYERAHGNLQGCLEFKQLVKWLKELKQLKDMKEIEMTKEEAIMELNRFSGTTQLKLSANFWTALDIAIKALEKEPCNDVISRQDVLNTLDSTDKFLDETRTIECYKTLLEECYKNLPSVTPTKCIATVKFSKEDMRELIDEKMKDIVVERKKGKWIPHRAKYDETAPIYECSICHKNNGFENTNYCPNCGCLMSKGEKE